MIKVITCYNSTNLMLLSGLTKLILVQNRLLFDGVPFLFPPRARCMPATNSFVHFWSVSLGFEAPACRVVRCETVATTTRDNAQLFSANIPFRELKRIAFGNYAYYFH